MTAASARCLNCRATYKSVRENGVACEASFRSRNGESVIRHWARHKWVHPNREVPLAILGGRVIRWATLGDLAYWHEKTRRAAGWARQDWHSSLGDIVIEREMWQQDIPFSGDVRAYLVHGAPPQLPAWARTQR